MSIDGYSHCGISKYRPVEEVWAVMRSAGVSQAVLCQHLGEYDNSYLADVVTRDPQTFAAVCLIDPSSPTAVADLEYWHATGVFRGVRLYAGWLNEYAAVWTRAVELGLTLVIYASEGAAFAAPPVARFVSTHPEARVVMTHLGNPQLHDGRPAESDWLSLAEFAGVYVQLSGLSMFCEFPHTELDDLVRATVRAFGAQRVYWGSNFPVCGGAAEYQRDLQHVLGGAWGLTTDQVQAITSGTAKRLWFA
ncbi:MAG: amidohydrolase [Planctomycetaceae bacterium]|nr:amidohydrolase [Planctomycetaceae bacterium]